MSAASFLGISGMVALQGYDGMIYATGWLVGWPALMFLVAEPLRNLGKFTFADVVAFRLQQRPVRIAAAVGGILTVLFYTIAQMVGSGQLIKLMFGIPYEWAEIIVGTRHARLRALRRHARHHLGADHQGGPAPRRRHHPHRPGAGQVRLEPGQPLQRGVGQVRPGALEPGGFVSSPLEAVSLGLALMFGLLGLPHILMRFYTVPDAKAARKSVLYATGLIGYFYVIIPIVGFGAAVLVGRDVGHQDRPGRQHGGPAARPSCWAGRPSWASSRRWPSPPSSRWWPASPWPAPRPSRHDIYVSVIKRGKASEEDQLKVARIATIVFGVCAIALGIAFKGQNVAFMVGLAFAIAASANFPALLMSIVWKRFTTQGRGLVDPGGRLQLARA